ncbi:hypothetical protein R5R35_012411 [Gryllus longicercus]|uniref:Uncharacterized protein n=1 Tax=Gryllus longicercus TaxID=2509291 RepID=A0AAN9VK20_9ORTH
MEDINILAESAIKIEEEDLKPPIAVLVEPTEKNEKLCFGEDKDPLEPCCDNAASIKQEEGLFTEVSGAASSAGTSNEAAAGCVSDEEIRKESSNGTPVRVLSRM